MPDPCFCCHISFLICGGFVKLCNVLYWIYLPNLWLLLFFKKYFFFCDVVFHFVRFLPSKLWTPWRRDQTDNDDDISIMRMWHHPEMMLHYHIPLKWHFHGTLNAEVSIALGAAGECLSVAQFRAVRAAVLCSIFCLLELQKVKVKMRSCWHDKNVCFLLHAAEQNKSLLKTFSLYDV